MKILTLLIALSLLVYTPASAHGEAIAVYYAGPEGGVYTALSLAAGFDEVEIVLVNDPAQADVLVLNGTIPSPARLHELVQGGTGLVLILGPGLAQPQVEALLGVPLALTLQDEPLSLTGPKTASDPVTRDIVWNSAPQVRERFALEADSAALIPLVTGFEDQSVILGKMPVGSGQAYVLTPFLDGANPQLQSWAYFNYFIYHLVMQAGGAAPLAFADYPGSPVPHTRERAILFALLAGTLVIAVLVFWIVRRYSLAHPEALDALVADREVYEANQEKTGWEQIGFQRPLGGFMLALMLGLVLFIPLIIYQNLILPVYILPSAQALGIWGRVVQFFEFMWLFFDMGTSAAFIKYFAECRVHDPRRAIQYGQVFVWWQVLSGSVQVAMVSALAGVVLPRTVYALYAWSIILHTLIQIPGFYLVMRHALMSWQRFDYAQMVDMGWKVIFPTIAQPIFVIPMVIWARTHPVFGTAMGGLLGLGIAAYASEAMTFALGLWLYRRTGYNTRLLFLAHFDWGTVKQSFRFGVFEMFGSVAWAVGQATEILITQTRLVNYTEIWGNWMLAQNFIFAFQVLSTLYSNVMPSISESFSNARIVLSQYYSAMSYKWGGIISAFIAAVLLAVADRFILGASGPEFVRAAAYAAPLIVWGAFQYPSWVGDNVQLGANRPYLKTALVAMEQIIRIVLALVLLERFQINALIIAYFVGLFTKNIVAYLVNHKLCFPQKFYFWQSLGAPALAGLAHWLVLRWLTGFIWQGDQITSILIFLIGILVSYPLFAFFYGLFGGWDDATLAELMEAAPLSNFMRPMVRLFWMASSLGARLSPIHGRFPIAIRRLALAEASSLNQEKVSVIR
ncbi:MAG: hypothetical protein EHM70_05350 [Chloroflexota bacterium]|nr:MAG: hypothetical protein EHM70_05350 [Chloroflexota bacterium]